MTTSTSSTTTTIDPDTPLEETLGALHTAVISGKALYVGISSYSDQRTAEAVTILRQLGTPLLIHQPSYSMLNRWIEDRLLDVLGAEGVGCIAFSVLAQGLLTDRYLNGVPPGSRASLGGSLTRDMLNDENLDRIRALNDIAQGRGQSLAQMAIAWALRDPRVTSALDRGEQCGPTRTERRVPWTTSSSAPRRSPPLTATPSTAASTCGAPRPPPEATGTPQLGNGASSRPVVCVRAPTPVPPPDGIVTVTDRPPSARGLAVAVPPWIAAMELTMARPSPNPSWAVRSAQSLERLEDAVDVRRADDRAGIGHDQLTAARRRCGC